jgi:transposase
VVAAIQPPFMEKKTRRQYSPEEKVRILRLHLLEGKPVSEICEQAGIHPTLFYQWQRTFFENGAVAFSSPRTETKSTAAEKKIETLESRLKRKDEVIAEIMEDFIRAKKQIGES